MTSPPELVSIWHFNLMEFVRLDKWLWAVRLFKTRARATEACRKSKVRINGDPAKPASKVRPGDRVETRLRDITRTYRVVELAEKRVGADSVPDLVVDETTDEEKTRAREFRENARLQIPRGQGRPTKKNRRDLEKFFGSPDPNLKK